MNNGSESVMLVCRKGTLPWKWFHRKLSLRCTRCPHCYIENNGKVECDIFLSNEPCPVEESKDEGRNSEDLCPEDRKEFKRSLD